MKAGELIEELMETVRVFGDCDVTFTEKILHKAWDEETQESVIIDFSEQVTSVDEIKIDNTCDGRIFVLK